MILLADYLNWQFLWGPRWIISTSWNGIRAITKMFSVPTMLKTLLAAWHKDTMSWHGGTLSQYGMVIGWNIISRLIGFIIRSMVLIVWLISIAIFIPMAVLAWLLFLLWPFIIFGLLTIGFTLVAAG